LPLIDSISINSRVSSKTFINCKTERDAREK
jgi:hypothetical protein